MKRSRSFWIVATVVGIAVLALAWWLGSPLFINRTVDEAFPASAPASSDAMADDEMKMATEEAMGTEEAMTEEDAMKMATEEAMGTEEAMTEEDAMKMATEEAMGTEEAMTEEDAMKMATEEAMGTEEAMMEEDAMATPDGPVALLAGTFRDMDSVHRGSGSATIYQLPDGSRTLRFEEFSVTNGPDLYVLLVPRADASSDLSGYIELATLKGNQGNQNYEIPAEIDLSSGEWSAVIWCKAFNVTFSVASLAQP